MFLVKCIKKVPMAVHLSDQFYLIFVKYLVPILELLTKNKYTVRDSFNFVIDIAEQYSGNFMGSLDIDSLFTNIPLEETIQICTNNIFKNSDIVHGLKKSEFKDLLSLAIKESYFILNNRLYKK